MDPDSTRAFVFLPLSVMGVQFQARMLLIADACEARCVRQPAPV
ncbi:MAG: hypothetical protein ABJB12_20990 [Pseudomonadota bacterium]